MTAHKENHESYGMISVSRAQAGGRGCTLFASPIKHNSMVIIQISEASVDHEGDRSYVMPGKKITEVYLSPAEFANMLTNTNTTGVPCTLHYAEGTRREAPPEETTSIQDKSAAYMVKIHEDILKRIKDLETVVQDAAIGKRVKESINHELGVIHSHLKSNIPHVQNSFHEHMEKKVVAAKAEIEATITNRMLIVANGEMVKQLEANRDEIQAIDIDIS